MVNHENISIHTFGSRQDCVGLVYVSEDEDICIWFIGMR